MINKIEKSFQREVEDIFDETKPYLEKMLLHLETVGSFEIFNGEVTLKTIPVRGEEKKAILIKNEQHVDFSIILYDSFTDFYGFEHYYDKEGYDTSMINEISIKGISEKIIPFLRCRYDEDTEILEKYSIYDYPLINNFEVTLNSIFCKLDYDYIAYKDFYTLNDLVSHSVAQLLKKQRLHIVNLFSNIKNETEIENMKIVPIKINTSLSKKKTSEYDIKDAIVIDLDECQFVMVSNYIYNDEDEESCNVEVFYCEKQESYQFSTLDILKNDYHYFRNCKIFTIDYNNNKMRKTKRDNSKSNSAAGYFIQIRTILELIEKINKI